MATEVLQPPPPASSDLVEFDTPCRQCMYSLRALPTDGRCPECGAPVRDSISDSILARCDPAEIRRTAGAMRFVLWATLGFVAAAAFGNLARLTPIAGVDAMVRQARTQMSLELLACLVLAAAHWRLGRPITSDENSGSRVRRLYRASLVAAVTVQLLVFAVRMDVPFPLPGTRRIAIQFLTWTGNTAFAVTVIGFLLYGRELAARIPNDRLVRAASYLCWVCGVPLVLFQWMGLIALLVPPRDLSVPVVAALAGAVLAAGTFLAGSAGAMVLLHRLRVWFTRAANASSR